MNETIQRYESEVRSYCRSFPTVFTRAEGSVIEDQEGRRYLDFFAGAGALNYGHNNPHLRAKLVEYVGQCGVTHGLDMATEAKCQFIEAFQRHILAPRNLSYKVMFPGPTGTNSVEAALKLARKVTGRPDIIAFTNAFHGMTLGSLALTGNASKRHGAGISLGNVTRMPFDGYMGPGVDTLDYLEAVLSDPSSGVDAPAAFIVETVQAEGGLNVASARWLSRLAGLAKQHGSLLIVDDIQVGCGRTGPFFSFEDLGIVPDVVCLSKSLSGYGLPFALTLFRPELDQWSPGEHNGTFRGNNLAFVTGAAVIEHYWKDDSLTDEVRAKADHMSKRLTSIATRFGARRRGRAFIQGIAFEDTSLACEVAGEAFRSGLVIETSGAHDEVLKLLPPITISQPALNEGLDIIEEALEAVRKGRAARRNGAGPRSNRDVEAYA